MLQRGLLGTRVLSPAILIPVLSARPEGSLMASVYTYHAASVLSRKLDCTESSIYHHSREREGAGENKRKRGRARILRSEWMEIPPGVG